MKISDIKTEFECDDCGIEEVYRSRFLMYREENYGYIEDGYEAQCNRCGCLGVIRRDIFTGVEEIFWDID